MLRYLKLKQVWIPLIAIVVIVIAISFFRTSDEHKSIAFSDVVSAAQNRTLESVDVHGHDLDVRLKGDETKYTSKIGDSTDIARALGPDATSSTNAEPFVLRYHDASAGGRWLAFIVQLVAAPIIIYFAVFFAVRNAQRRSTKE